MKRYPTIDFLRGLAIFMMIFVHMFMRWFDQGKFEAELMAGNINLFLVITLLVLLFLGGWAGFFLMISSIGNMISMFKGLEKGQSAKALALRQIVGGFLLLFFAYLTEGVIGYKGALGELAMGDSNWFQLILHRGYHQETIHAVAWCVIINGVVQAILSYNGGWKNIKRNITIYAVLAILVIVATQFVWDGFNALAGGVSWANDPRELLGGIKIAWDQGHLLYYDFFTNVLYIFAAPWAGSVEPLFPFLSVSFIGSIIGLYLMKRKDEPESKDTKPLKIGIGIGFFIALAGFLFMLLLMLEFGADPLHLFSESDNLPALNTDLQWLAMFLFVTGSQIGAILFILRVVEFRGKSKQFAKKTLFFRRFGFVAFSVYNYQMLDILAIFLIGLIPGIPAFEYGKSGHLYLISIWPALVTIFVIWGVVLWLWEKINYAFGLEWFIAKISGVLIPSKRRKTEEKQPWWKTPRLDPQAALIEAEWIDIISEEQTDHENLKDSKLAKKVALCGLIFPPAYFISLGITKESMKTEGENKHNKAAKIINIIGIIAMITIIVVLFILQSQLLFDLEIF
ncbi:MAG: heparan-alpha-glucosaminide N-acetyltransferase domain-containing protein [Candidatus Hodarchaeota archaeon]